MTTSSSIFDDGRAPHGRNHPHLWSDRFIPAKLIAKAAVEWGVRPILAGRNIEKVEAVAEPLGLIGRAFDLGAPRSLTLRSRTCRSSSASQALFRDGTADGEACIRNRVHYLDITGEIDVFEAMALRDAEAKRRA